MSESFPIAEVAIPDRSHSDLNVDPLTRRLTGVTHHGSIPFDVPYISHVGPNFYLGGCANGLVLPDHVEHVVSLYPWEQYTLTRQPRSITFHWLYDTAATPPPIVRAIAGWVNECVGDGPTLLHCQAGLNRSALVAVLVLMKRGQNAAQAIAWLRAARSPAVLCNSAFEAWLHNLEAA